MFVAKGGAAGRIISYNITIMLIQITVTLYHINCKIVLARESCIFIINTAYALYIGYV